MCIRDRPESDSMPVKSDGSTSDGSEAETSSSLPVSDNMASDEMDADSEPASGSETAESDVDAKDEDSSGVTAATTDEQSVSVTVSEEYAILLATNQADSMMGHAGMRRSDACTQPAASFTLLDYAAETEDESYCLLWDCLLYTSLRPSICRSWPASQTATRCILGGWGRKSARFSA